MAISWKKNLPMGAPGTLEGTSAEDDYAPELKPIGKTTKVKSIKWSTQESGHKEAEQPLQKEKEPGVLTKEYWTKPRQPTGDFNWGNVGKSAGIGASLGGAIGAIGAGAGAVPGAALGGFGGTVSGITGEFLRSKVGVPEYVSTGLEMLTGGSSNAAAKLLPSTGKALSHGFLGYHGRRVAEDVVKGAEEVLPEAAKLSKAGEAARSKAGFEKPPEYVKAGKKTAQEQHELASRAKLDRSGIDTKVAGEAEDILRDHLYEQVAKSSSKTPFRDSPWYQIMKDKIRVEGSEHADSASIKKAFRELDNEALKTMNNNPNTRLSGIRGVHNLLQGRGKFSEGGIKAMFPKEIGNTMRTQFGNWLQSVTGKNAYEELKAMERGGIIAKARDGITALERSSFRGLNNEKTAQQLENIAQSTNGAADLKRAFLRHLQPLDPKRMKTEIDRVAETFMEKGVMTPKDVNALYDRVLKVKGLEKSAKLKDIGKAAAVGVTTPAILAPNKQEQYYGTQQ